MPSPSTRPGFLRRRGLLVLAAAVAVWLALGWRSIPPDHFGVASAPAGAGWWTRPVAGSWALAPPGLVRLELFPRTGVELSLPPADEAMLSSADGRRYGHRGWVTVRAREEAWQRLHEAAHGAGLRGVLLDAVRDASSGLEPTFRGDVPTAAYRQRFEQALAEALDERGAVAREIALERLDFLTARDGAPSPTTGAKVLVVGLDGADWAVIDPLLAAGRLPNLNRLIENGARAKLLSIRPLLSPVVWTTVATGVEPRRHGVLDFLVADPASGQQEPVTSAQRLVPTFWEILSRSGIDVGVVAWWASWPADPVRGYLVSDRLAYQLFGFHPDQRDARGMTWPPELYDEIRPSIVEPDDVSWDQIEPYLDGPRRRLADFDDHERGLLDGLRSLIASGQTYLSVGTELSRRFAPDLEVVYFEGTDTVAHLFMPYRDPPLPGVGAAGRQSFAQVIDIYYETADRMLGSLLAERGEDWTVLVLSDHGFAADETRPIRADSRIGHGAAAEWHRRFGIVVLSGRHIVPGARIEEASVYDIAPTVLALFGQPVPRSWPGRVLGTALDPGFLEEHPVRYRDDDPERRDRLGDDLDDPAAAELIAKLRTLGYVSSIPGDESGSITMRNNTGLALLSEGKLEEAEAEFRGALASNPGIPNLELNLGLVLRLQGRLGEAETRFRSAMAHPATRRGAGDQLAQVLLDSGRWVEAEEIARTVLSEEPNAAEVHTTLGEILEARGELSTAAASYWRAADLDPHSARSRNHLGSLAHREGDLARAEEWFRAAIEADPYYMGAYNNLALIYQARGQSELALDLYDRALARSPRNAVVLNNLANLHYATGNAPEARRLWQRSMEARPDFPSPRNNLAGLMIAEKSYDEAEPLLRQALEIDPAYGDARLNLALVLRWRGDVAGARRELEQAVEDPRTGANGWYQLGAFELEVGTPEAAVRALEQGRRVAPGSPEMLNALGDAYVRAGVASRAKESWSASLRIVPDQPRVRAALEQLERLP